MQQQKMNQFNLQQTFIDQVLLLHLVSSVQTKFELTTQE